MIGLAALAAATQLAGCLPVSGDYISAGDLATAVPEFAAVDSRERVGYTPNPGARRTFRANDIERLAERLEVEITRPREVCFEWTLRLITEEETLAAMRKALENPEVEIEILELSRHPAPKGRLIFDPDRLNPPAGSDASRPVVWNGFIEYGERRRFKIWARVQLSAPTQRLVATHPIRAGATIGRGDVRVQEYEGFPRSFAPQVQDVVGRISVRPLQEGMIIPTRLLRDAPLVRFGDEVSVVVRAGRALIRLEAQARGSGKLGDTIKLRNMKSGKIFDAKVVGPGRVSVIAPGG